MIQAIEEGNTIASIDVDYAISDVTEGMRKLSNVHRFYRRVLTSSLSTIYIYLYIYN